MLKLYRLAPEKREYWETWDNDNGSHTVHLGLLGTRGESKELKSTLTVKAAALIQQQIDDLVAVGFRPIRFGRV